jgi:hypothetical protein
MERTPEMNTHRKTAVLVGVLFIVGTVSGIMSGVVTAPIRAAAAFPLNISTGESQWITGTLLVLLMGLSLAMMPVALYPILKKKNEVLALGAVVFRGAMEGMAYAAMAINMLLMLSVSEIYGNASAGGSSNFQALGYLLVAAKNWIEIWVALVFSIGALMIYAAFYQARLVPRWLSGWGFVGGALYFVANLTSMFGSQHIAPDIASGIGQLMIPLAVQEMVFAVWMIVKGFDSSALASLSTETE